MTEDFDIEAPPPEEEGSNRTFMVAVGAIGGLLILSMVCLGVYALVIAPGQAQNREAQATQIVLENTRVAASFTETAQAARPTLVPTQPPPTATSSPTITPTQVVVDRDQHAGGDSAHARPGTGDGRRPGNAECAAGYRHGDGPAVDGLRRRSRPARVATARRPAGCGHSDHAASAHTVCCLVDTRRPRSAPLPIAILWAGSMLTLPVRLGARCHDRSSVSRRI